METQSTAINLDSPSTSPCLCNQLPSSLRQPHSTPSASDLSVHAPITSSHSVNSPLSPSITLSLSFTPSSRPTSFTNLSQHRLHGPFDWTISAEHLGLFLVSSFRLVPCCRWSWLFVRFWAHVNTVHCIVLYRVLSQSTTGFMMDGALLPLWWLSDVSSLLQCISEIMLS